MKRKEERPYKILISFMKENSMPVVLFLLFGAIVTVVSYLYTDDIRGVVHGLMICLFLGACCLLYRFYRYQAAEKRLMLVKKNLNISLLELPRAENKIEENYQEIIEMLYREKNELNNTRMKLESETNDYYTMWVHQIKTPIAAMRLLVQAEQEPARRMRMEQELFRTEQYVQMVLHYLHLQSQSSDFLWKEYDVYDITKAALRKYSISFIEKKLSIDFEEFHYQVVTDEKWLELVIEQILSNCVKYTFEGGIAITFEAGEKPVLKIRDTGIGIREEDLPRIFEKGYTGYNGHMDKKSTGIGLYLCKKVVDKLGLELTVCSEVSQGTEYKLSLF